MNSQLVKTDFTLKTSSLVGTELGYGNEHELEELSRMFPQHKPKEGGIDDSTNIDLSHVFIQSDMHACSVNDMC